MYRNELPTFFFTTVILIAYESILESYLAAVWRHFYCDRVSYCKSLDDGYHYWYSIWLSDSETGWACFMAVRQRGEEHPRFGRLPQYHNEYSLAVSWWNLDQPFSPGMGDSALYHNHWYTIRETTLQTCRTGSDSLRKGYCR